MASAGIVRSEEFLILFVYLLGMIPDEMTRTYLKIDLGVF
jgi:hypothetical protein